jgi:mannosylglycerate hydrolase
MKTQKILVVSNTHWDREFRQSFEKTRRNLLVMLDTTLDILENDIDYHSFTLDGHSILLDDYLEMRPEKRSLIESLIKAGRLIAGPWYTLAEQFSVSHEPLIRNLMWGRETIKKLGGKTGTVAYTPASWGQTGQLPQILKDFGLTRMMFYRGISHHESDAEFIWAAPDGSDVMASRFAIYARYNWYYQVHRPLTRDGRVFEKDFRWGEFDEVPLRVADSESFTDPSFELIDPSPGYNPEHLERSITGMIERESGHFTTPVFLAMHGHDISVAHPMESKIIKKAKKLFIEKLEIVHGNLEDFWNEAGKYIDVDKLARLEGERRSYLKKGMWTYLFPATISARTYLKQLDFEASRLLVYEAEPLAAMAFALGTEYPSCYLDRAWKYLLSNHTHDANGGCAPDEVCRDMEYRYRKVTDISGIVAFDAMAFVAKNLEPSDMGTKSMQLVVFNPLPFCRDAVVAVDLQLPSELSAGYVKLVSPENDEIEIQHCSNEESSIFVDNIWDVPSILQSERIRIHARFTSIPPLGYRTYQIIPDSPPGSKAGTLITGKAGMENEYLALQVNSNGTLNILNKITGKLYQNLNYLTDQGEAGNAWQHEDLPDDQKLNSLGVSARVIVAESGPLTSTLLVNFEFPVPTDYGDGITRNKKKVALPVSIFYRLDKGIPYVKVKLIVNNLAKDHWFRANFPTGIDTLYTWADSHFDVVKRDIRIPDSTGWVERARGTHPLRTFVEMHDHENSFALFTKGLFEYEAFEDTESILALTLIRACRIKLAVSEEKKTELPDKGIQCPGEQCFEYAICTGPSNWLDSFLPNLAVEFIQPVRCLMSGRGKGKLSAEKSVLSVDNKRLHVTAVKKAMDGESLLIRLYNPSGKEEPFTLSFYKAVTKAFLAGMDESPGKPLVVKSNKITYIAAPKKIITMLIEMEK